MCLIFLILLGEGDNLPAKNSVDFAFVDAFVARVAPGRLYQRHVQRLVFIAAPFDHVCLAITVVLAKLLVKRGGRWGG